ncbi:MAG TPA: RagB/SusD family nutrient uptake outer membrane protein [Gemmatimonadaceae bacterium]|nr:RagB/SusD family nutrient uptake outer membrane protein [Gemmatimonadaceae bacterium]
MTNPTIQTRTALRATIAAALLGAATLVACDQDKLLTAPTPDVVLPGDITSRAALPSAFASAVGDFQLAYAGGYGAQLPLLDYNEGLAQMTALLTDELLNAETYNTRIEVDRRATTIINSSTLQTFQVAQQARATADLVAERYRELDPENPQRAEAQALAAFLYVMFAEGYCNGVPTSRVLADGSFEYGSPQTGSQLLTTAVAKFDSAITVAVAAGSAGSTALNLARIGKGRALLDLGNYAAAAAAVAAVPSTFVYEIQHSETTGRQNNAFFAFNYLESRFTIAEKEGINGLPFVTLDDPRAPVYFAGDVFGDVFEVGFDGSTPLFFTTKYFDYDSPTPLAVGAEARLIEAEAALKAGDVVTFLAKLNEARAAAPTYPSAPDATSPPRDKPAPLTAADVPASTAGRVDLLFRERALALFLTGHRVGDLRRLTYQYGRATESVWPTGPYQDDNPDKQGTNYGPDVNLPIPQEESNNPQFAGQCTNRSANIQ